VDLAAVAQVVLIPLLERLELLIPAAVVAAADMTAQTLKQAQQAAPASSF
jgi:hypothetical protein